MTASGGSLTIDDREHDLYREFTALVQRLDLVERFPCAVERLVLGDVVLAPSAHNTPLVVVERKRHDDLMHSLFDQASPWWGFAPHSHESDLATV